MGPIDERWLYYSCINKVKENGTDEGIDPAVPGNEENEDNNPCNERHQRASGPVGHIEQC